MLLNKHTPDIIVYKLFAGSTVFESSETLVLFCKTHQNVKLITSAVFLSILNHSWRVCFVVFMYEVYTAHKSGTNLAEKKCQLDTQVPLLFLRYTSYYFGGLVICSKLPLSDKIRPALFESTMQSKQMRTTSYVVFGAHYSA